jgi:hypothetical protein
MARSRPRVREAASAHRHELPIVATFPKSEFQDPKGAVVPNLAAVCNPLEFVVARSSGSNYELSRAGTRITKTVSRHRSESLVDVIVSRDDHFDSR